MTTKFKVGDTVRIHRPFLRMGRNHVGATGVILETRSYGRGSGITHYVVKFDCYRIPHLYMLWDIDESCVIVNQND